MRTNDSPLLYIKSLRLIRKRTDFSLKGMLFLKEEKVIDKKMQSIVILGKSDYKKELVKSNCFEAYSSGKLI